MLEDVHSGLRSQPPLLHRSLRTFPAEVESVAAKETQAGNRLWLIPGGRELHKLQESPETSAETENLPVVSSFRLMCRCKVGIVAFWSRACSS